MLFGRALLLSTITIAYEYYWYFFFDQSLCILFKKIIMYANW